MENRRRNQSKAEQGFKGYPPPTTYVFANRTLRQIKTASQTNPAHYAFDWVSNKMSEGLRITHTFSSLMNKMLPEALGPPGVSGDPVKLVYVSRRLGETYKAALDWAREAKLISVPDEYKTLVSIVGGFLNTTTKRIEEAGTNLLQRLNEGIARGQAEGGTIVVELTITFELDGLDQFN